MLRAVILTQPLLGYTSNRAGMQISWPMCLLNPKNQIVLWKPSSVVNIWKHCLSVFLGKKTTQVMIIAEPWKQAWKTEGQWPDPDLCFYSWENFPCPCLFTFSMQISIIVINLYIAVDQNVADTSIDLLIKWDSDAIQTEHAVSSSVRLVSLLKICYGFTFINVHVCYCLWEINIKFCVFM